jgi:hypothetical protein
MDVCDDCVVPQDEDEHNDKCWSECVENDYPHLICKRCVERLKNLASNNEAVIDKPIGVKDEEVQSGL